MSIAFARKFPFLQALRSRPFALLWSGQTISSLGDGAFNTAVIWQVLMLTGSATAIGLVMIAQTLPMIIFLLFGGVAADRFSRKRMMLLSDASRAVAVLVIAGLALAQLLQLWHLVVLSLFFGTVRGFFMPAYQSILPQLVKKDELASANSLTELSSQIYALLGPILGAACTTLAGPATAFVFDGLTFLISALCLLGLRLPMPDQGKFGQAGETPAAREALRDIGAGLRYVAASPILWVTIVLAAISSIGGAGAVQVALPKLIQSTYGQGVWLLGTVWVAGGVGSLAALPLIPLFNRHKKRGLIIYLALGVSGFALIAFALPLPQVVEPFVACLAMGILTLGQTIGEVLWTTVLQERVPDDKLGRVNSINQLAGYGLWPLGFVLAGILTDRVSPIWTFLGAGVLIAGLYGLALSARRIRRAEEMEPVELCSCGSEYRLRSRYCANCGMPREQTLAEQMQYVSRSTTLLHI